MATTKNTKRFALKIGPKGGIDADLAMATALRLRHMGFTVEELPMNSQWTKAEIILIYASDRLDLFPVAVNAMAVSFYKELRARR